MVGGIVIETIVLPEKVWVNCRGTGSEKRDTCAIYVERSPTSESIEVGDKLWWQGGYAFWTPAAGNFSDLAIPRLSYSGVNRSEGY